ncbi:MFS transporter [Burkholderia diffusa]|uniref:MFS transporter n=1 Tax=Burkholderia diffusa TaxID=488732 RepID=UPI00157B9F5F|nr:MFS transporter [Burkholderia diffusa]NTY39404.1 MFS transporter [Burkholderia diffusa]
MTDCQSTSVAVPVPAPVATASRPTARGRHLTLALVAIGMFMAVLDTTIVNVALPAMRASLGATVAHLAWIVDAYTLSFAALILAGGTASDRFGAANVYLAGLALFVGASAACGLAPSVAVLVAARFVQGVGAALFLPASLAIVRGTFEVPAERARAIAVWAGIASVAASVGPVLGGILVEGFGWRSAFLVNVPTGAAAFAGAALLVRMPASRHTRRFDWAGQFASAAALGALCFAAIELPTRGLGAPAVWGAMLAAGLATAVLVVVERRVREPMVPPAWFRNRVFVAMNLMGGLVYVGYFGLLFVLSLYLHGSVGLNARQTGLMLLPLALSLSLGNLLSGKLHGRASAARLMSGGLGMATLAVVALAGALAMRAPWPVTWAAMAAFGTGTALSVAPMISTVLDQVPADAAGVASGFLNAARQAGSLLGVAIAGAATMLLPNPAASLWAVAAVSSAAYAIAALAALTTRAGAARGAGRRG